MSKNKKTNYAKVSAWLADGMKAEFDGTVSACALTLFECIQDDCLRQKILNLMQAFHYEQVNHHAKGEGNEQRKTG